MNDKTRVALLALVALACDLGGAGRFEQVGYFKDDSNNRVKTFIMPPDATPEAIRAHASAETKTQSRFFAAYYYAPGSRVPADGVTLASGFMAASDVIHEGPGLSAWRFVYMTPLVGSTTFVDCEATPADDLCRQ